MRRTITETTVAELSGVRVGVANIWEEENPGAGGAPARVLRATLSVMGEGADDFDRRLGAGDTVLIAGEAWRVVAVSEGQGGRGSLTVERLDRAADLSDEEFFAALSAEQQAAAARALAAARAEAAARGKEPFDLDAFERLFDTTTEMGSLPPRERREATYLRKYYVVHADVTTMQQLAKRLEALAPWA